MLDGSGSISFDVLTWLNEQKVPLVKIDWTGSAVTVISGDSFAANRHRVAWQAETRSDPRKRMEFCNALIAKKIEGCIQTLETSLRRSFAWDRAMKRARDDLTRIANDPPRDGGRTAPVGSPKCGRLFSGLVCDGAFMASLCTPSHSR